jgi:transcriptional antiterminator RfaH
MTNTIEQRWYVVQTRPRAEHRASQHLSRQGFATYLPLHLIRRRHAARLETVAAPLFPGYLFVAVDVAQQRWRSIHSTIGVTRLVCNGVEPAAVPDRVMADLQASQDEYGFIHLDAPSRLAPGDKVRVLQGAFSSCVGLFEGATADQRVAVLLDLLGRKVRVNLDSDLVAAA